MINVLVVDDHGLVRRGIRRILDDVSGIKVVAEAESGEEALKLARQLKPEVVLMDVKMPGIGGFEATRKLIRLDPDIKVLICTICTNDIYPSRLLHLGAFGYLTKDAGPDEMVVAIRAVHSGQRYLPSDIAQKMALNQFKSVDDNPFNALSDRELQIMIMITRGDKVPSISEHLNLSTKTINSYRYRMFEKLGVSNDVELTHLAIRFGMLKTEKL